jgi:alpha-glucosidase
MLNRLSGTLFLLLAGIGGQAQKDKAFALSSPDGNIKVTIVTVPQLQWSVSYGSQQVLAPSGIALFLANGEVWGKDMKALVSNKEQVDQRFAANFYKKDSITDRYNELRLVWKGNHGILFRVYNDGAAYRFFSNSRDSLIIRSEQATFNFDKDYQAFIPYVREPRLAGDQHETSFEALYDETKLSGMIRDSLAFLPLLVDLGNGMKAVVTEADLEHYPGMYLKKNAEKDFSMIGDFANYPLTERSGGYENINSVVPERTGFIAVTKGKVQFPWRILVISKRDQELANSDMVQKLGAPCRLNDISWIKPGKVAWDWWNDWNISHVDFRAGINTPTYKYYIDFAAANKLEYIIMDEGWSDRMDLLKMEPGVDLQAILDYGKQKKVGIILWATWSAVHAQMDAAFAKYSAMGVRGFKIDFLDRDDQEMTGSTYAIAARAADYKLMVDFHGMYKPDGIQRTYPNVVNCEGVRGMENAKWAPHDDVPRYDVTLPFIRMLAGPMDYTPGAMRNSTRAAFHPVNSMPMSQGTRCHQLAMYTVFEAPLEMLADNPTVYMKEQESTTFISGIPTTFDETIALDGKVGEYIVMARRKNRSWYIGAMTNWDARDISLDLSFLPAGKYVVELFQDGINADRDATDYKRNIMTVSSGDKLNVHLSNGGGLAAKILPQELYR